MDNTALTVILIINAFVLGAVIALAAYHARAHRAATPERREPKKAYLPVLPHDARQRILDEAEEEYSQVLEKTAEDLERSLAATTDKLTAELDRLGGSVMSDEMKAYKSSLSRLRDETADSIAAAQAEITEHQIDVKQKLAARQEAIDRQLTEHESQLSALIKTREQRLAEHQARLDADLLEHQRAHEAKRIELEAKLEQDMQVRRETYEKQIDEKLSEAIAAFLTETLGHQVDLGSQKQYLLAVLDEHKDELKRGLE